MWKTIVPRLAVAGLASAVLLAACSPGASPAPSASGTPGASAAGGGSGAIDHPTGTTQVVLRFEEGGGFVALAFAMLQVPYFSLYGDGTVIFRSASAPFPEQKPGDPTRFAPLHVARMTETQAQALLAGALGPGGLREAKPRYENLQVADAPTAVFTIDAGGVRKQVSVYALGLAADGAAGQGPDAATLAAMADLAERLRDFDREIAKGAATDVGLFVPDRFRASILEAGAPGARAPRPWPWPTFGPDAFAAVDQPSGPGFPSKVLSGLEASLLGLGDLAGGVSGIALRGPDGKVYDLALRPLLPDEQR